MSTPVTNTRKPPLAPPSAGRSIPPNPLRQKRLDEPPFQLNIEPRTKITFKSDKITEEPVVTEVKIKNTSKNRQTFIIKCTANDIFRVRPPMGFIAPGEKFPITLMLKTKKVPPPSKHFFAFYHMSCSNEDKNPRTLWTLNIRPEGIKRIPCEFVKTDGTAYSIYKCFKMASIDDLTNENKPNDTFSK